MSQRTLEGKTDCRKETRGTLQWDNRSIWSLEELLAWVRQNHMDQTDIRDHIDLILGKYRQELTERQGAGPDPLDEVYEKFKHLDTCLSDPKWCEGGNGSAIYGIAGEMYRAIKEYRQKRGRPV